MVVILDIITKMHNVSGKPVTYVIPFIKMDLLIKFQLWSAGVFYSLCSYL